MFSPISDSHIIGTKYPLRHTNFISTSDFLFNNRIFVISCGVSKISALLPQTVHFVAPDSSLCSIQ